jgi:hypothetical protein
MHKIFKCFSHFMQDEFMLCLPLASTDSCSKRNSKSSIMLKSRLSIYWIIDYNFCLPTLLNFHQIQSYYKFLFWNNLDTIIDIFKGTSLLIDNYVMFVYLLPVPLSQTRVANTVFQHQVQHYVLAPCNHLFLPLKMFPSPPPLNNWTTKPFNRCIKFNPSLKCLFLILYSMIIIFCVFLYHLQFK